MSCVRILIPMVLGFLTGCFSLEPPPEFTGPAASSTDGDSATETENDTENDTEIDSDTGEPPEDSETLEDTETDSQTDTGTDEAPRTCADGIFCYDPPKECSDDASVKIFELPGYCVDDEEEGARCGYRQIDVMPCTSGGCSNGICEESPCDGVLCVQPVTRECNDAGTRLWFYGGDLNAPGECVVENGTPRCRYDNMESLGCSDECIVDHCTDGLCYGVICGTPPGAYCKDDTLHRFSESGIPTLAGNTCECLHTEDTEECDNLCEEGRCTE